MNDRTKSLWWPATVNLTIAGTLLIILELVGVKPYMVQVSGIAMAFPLPWFLVLPLAAATGSFLAKRAQASSEQRLAAGLAPSLVLLAVFCAITLVFAFDRHAFPSGFPLPLDYFALLAAGWVFLPVLPLLVGTLPFLKKSEVRER